MLYRCSTLLLSFKIKAHQKRLGVEKRGHISDFLSPVNIREGVGEMSELRFCVTRTTQSLYTFDAAPMDGLGGNSLHGKTVQRQNLKAFGLSSGGF